MCFDFNVYIYVFFFDERIHICLVVKNMTVFKIERCVLPYISDLNYNLIQILTHDKNQYTYKIEAF